MLYLLIFVLLLILELIYFRIADRYNIIDKPNQRSSHDRIVIRGGGILFPIAALMWWIANGWQYPFLITGLLLVAVVSFLDDIFTLSNKIRLVVQFSAAALIMYGAGLSAWPWMWWIPVLIIIVGWKNAFNFMDGINGISALYALSAIGGFLYVNSIHPFTDNELIIYTALAVLVFSFFNLRKRAKCFAGDVGAVTLAFLLAFWMLQLILASGHVLYLLFFAVYGVDAVLTIIHRLFKRENIFQAHRSHLYQYMANEMKMGHVPVSVAYFAVQALINCLVIYWVGAGNVGEWWLFFGVLGVLGLGYVWGKWTILRGLAKADRR